ncbi:MAG TPA: serine hydrolase [Thermoanaerobaculia bacterium]|nr:serine hydrolase [Thermoanaerobaculia bacterium]
MNCKRASLAVALLVSLACLGASSSAQPDKVDEYVEAEMQRIGVPGLSIAVVRNGQVVKAKGYGLANVELNVAATPETIYQSGSIGKQFTATLVMMLVEEGKLSLDDPIGKHIADAPAIWKGITVRHLLTHTSGISNALYGKIDMRRDYTEDELLREIAALPLDFQPGERWNYSNPGYVTLGILIHKVSGKFYGDLLREKIFGPLGMATARVISESDLVPNRADGYLLVEGELKNQEWVSPTLNTTADGALYLTVLDMAKWAAALESEKLLKRASLDQMWTPVKLNSGKTEQYGFGWFVGDARGHRLISHGGAWQGFTAQISRYVDDQLTVIVMTNLAGGNPGKIAAGIAGLYVPEVAPLERKAIRIDPKLVGSYLGEYEVGPGITLRIFREGDSLWIQPTGQSRAELFPESEANFFLKVVDAQITFVKDPNGAVTQLILHQNGKDTEAKKIR